VRPHRRRRGQLPGRQQGRQGRLDPGLPLLGRQVQQPHVLPVRPPRLPGHPGVVGPPVRHRRVQVLAVDVAGERPRLARQPAADVAVVDEVLVLAAQPLHRLHQRPRVPDLDLLRPDPHLHRLADQPRRHRVGVVLDPDGAAPAHLDPRPLHRLQPPGRQRPQAGQLRRQPLLPAGVAARGQLPQELPVRRPAGEVAAAPQQQRLLDRLLEAPVPLLAVAVLVAARRVRGLRFQPVMGQQRPVLGRVPLGAALVVDGQRHAVGAVPPRHTAQLPQGVLQPLAEAGEALRGADAHVLPIRVGEHEVVDQVGERLALEGHAQGLHVGEVRGPQPAGLMHLGEEHLPGRPVLRLPLPHAPLQRPPAPLPIRARRLALQPLQQRLGLQPHLAPEQLLQLRPHGGKGVRPGPPGARPGLLAGQPGLVTVLAGGLAVHVGAPRGSGQRGPPEEGLPQFLDLGVRGPSAGTHRQLLSSEVAAVLGRARTPAQTFSGEG